MVRPYQYSLTKHGPHSEGANSLSGMELIIPKWRAEIDLTVSRVILFVERGIVEGSMRDITELMVWIG